MIYLDTSVALAHLLSEDRRPPPKIWQEEMIASRLLEYELYTRLHARNLHATHSGLLRPMLDQIYWLDLTREVLARALEPFPTTIRTLDALHLASLDYCRQRGLAVRLATYDERMRSTADAMGFALYELG